MKPLALAAEIARESGWSVYGASFGLEQKKASLVSSSIRLGEPFGACMATLSISPTSPAELGRTSTALRRAGYTTGKLQWLVAHRELRTMREMRSEIGRLESLRDLDALASFPARKVRNRKVAERPFPQSQLRYLASLSRPWICDWVAASRKGRPTFIDDDRWRCVAWCTLLLDVPEPPRLELGVQIHGAKGVEVTQADLRKAARRLHEHLGTHGYRPLKVKSGDGSPLDFRIVEKRVRTLADARRERRRLDRIVFGAR